jgi:GTPase SAR1 family protein
MFLIMTHVFLLVVVLSALFGVGPGASGRNKNTDTLLLVGTSGSGKTTLFHKL